MLLTGASLSGCIMNFRGSGYNYNGADKYRVFDGAVQDDFTKLDIGWISGDVTVVRGDSFGITEIIEETTLPNTVCTTVSTEKRLRSDTRLREQSLFRG